MASIALVLAVIGCVVGALAAFTNDSRIAGLGVLLVGLAVVAARL